VTYREDLEEEDEDSTARRPLEEEEEEEEEARPVGTTPAAPVTIVDLTYQLDSPDPFGKTYNT
jgi:hypothetical protein